MMAATQQQAAPGRSTLSYLTIAAWAQILSGIFHVFFSVLGLAYFFAKDPAGATEGAGWLTTLALGEPGAFTFADLVAAYLVFQVAAGWLLGLLSIYAGRLTQRGVGRGIIEVIAIANLILIPLGTTISSFILIGLRRPNVKSLFA